MIELTLGELRYIDESANAWYMDVRRIADSMGDVPEAVKTRISTLQEEYVEEFLEFYTAEKEKSTGLDSVDIQDKFDETWTKKHPDFYDMEKLFAECDKDKLKAAL